MCSLWYVQIVMSCTIIFVPVQTNSLFLISCIGSIRTREETSNFTANSRAYPCFTKTNTKTGASPSKTRTSIPISFCSSGFVRQRSVVEVSGKSRDLWGWIYMFKTKHFSLMSEFCSFLKVQFMYIVHLIREIHFTMK